MPVSAISASSADDGIILSYLRVGQAETDDSLALSTLQQHIDILIAADNRDEIDIQPLDKLVENLGDDNLGNNDGSDSPANPSATPAKPTKPKVAVTIDFPYLSTIEQAIPLFLNNRIPVTIFIPSGILDSGNPAYASWDDLNELAGNDLIRFGVLPRRYTPLTTLSDGQIRRQIIDSRNRIANQLGHALDITSIPYGRRSPRVDQVLGDLGMAHVIGRRSGVATGHRPYDLPRFIQTGKYGDTDRLRQLLKTTHLPIDSFSPDKSDITTDQESIELFGNELLRGDGDPPVCYADGHGKIDIIKSGPDTMRLTIPKQQLSGSLRINCLRQKTPEGPWQWYGLLYYVMPGADDDDT